MTKNSLEQLKKTKNSYATRSKLSENMSNKITEKNSGLKNPKISLTPRKTKSPTSVKELQKCSPSTPPKQMKEENDENNSTGQLTPSSLLRKLDINGVKNNNLQPKELFSSKFKSARKALHGTQPAQLWEREKEIEELRKFICDCLNNNKSGTLYISGPPGTGKTAALSQILKEKFLLQIKTIYINCTAIKSPSYVYSRIIEELNIKTSRKTEKENICAIEKYLSKDHKMIMLVLDELDQLDSKKQSVLYTIFEWPSRPNSKLILIGIANALDLTDRILPRLQARCELKPKLMHFASYSKEQIIHIIMERLKEAGVSDVLATPAVHLLAGKVAAISGDVRRALDISRRVIEIAERKNQNILRSLENFNNEVTEKVSQTVEVKEVVDVLNNVYGTSQNLNDDCDSFPLQQKIVVCALLLMLKKAKNKDITMGKLHEVYSRVCEKRNLYAVDQAEFVGLCSLIETKGVIRVAGKKEPRLHKVTLEWDEEEVVLALRDKELMSSILQDTTCLGRL
ncbi:cell division control protein 6 homolog [Agrilus planipennis]|uniref:Cell division control protein n=1 Tax=Agrilus planipennis TaxID=224129 RepID=A0A1W4XLM4_AGRPL|nr:cell division control protein 6 homolog [Agrilus planipennis]